MKSQTFFDLIALVRSCSLCADQLENGVRPVLQVNPHATILIAGQAPGSKVHASGIPFDDASGDRLREWMGISRSCFYNASKIAILPMGFCYPGKGKSGDLPPLAICAETWRRQILSAMPEIKLTLAIGTYAQNWHLHQVGKNLTENVRNWRSYDESVLPLPHPSPRNNLWLKKNGWFTDDVLPELSRRVNSVLFNP